MLLDLLRLCQSDDPEERPTTTGIIAVLDQLDYRSYRDLITKKYDQLKEQGLSIPQELEKLYKEIPD